MYSMYVHIYIHMYIIILVCTTVYAYLFPDYSATCYFTSLSLGLRSCFVLICLRYLHICELCFNILNCSHVFTGAVVVSV